MTDDWDVVDLLAEIAEVGRDAALPARKNGDPHPIGPSAAARVPAAPNPGTAGTPVLPGEASTARNTLAGARRVRRREERGKLGVPGWRMVQLLAAHPGRGHGDVRQAARRYTDRCRRAR